MGGSVVRNKIIWAILGLFLVLASYSPSRATLMTGSNNGGTAIVDFKTSIIGTTMYVTLDNLSPITLDSGSGDNAVGIVSFGFDLVDPNLVLNSWNFQAYYGSVLTDITSDWALVNKVGNLRLDLQASTQHNATLDGALYNPAWIANPNALPGGNHTSYFTSATMQLVFGGVPAIDDTSRYSPYVWVKNVGLSGDGSIKMTPEPWSLVLFGSGLLGFSFYHRRRTKFKS